MCQSECGMQLRQLPVEHLRLAVRPLLACLVVLVDQVQP